MHFQILYKDIINVLRMTTIQDFGVKRDRIEAK